LVELGCAWSSGSVRLRAIKLLADLDWDAALERALDDASATVRDWGSRLNTPRIRHDPLTGTRPSLGGK
jgi:hypothetical protein